ncbi:hypothetical protein BJS_05783 [Bradyrhizobium japonicum SEMIA 5079]|uniref:Uncharacterized protein n=1 Tax=Bradyrhizobium diazoefficiens SEMIA 5080 TaxID=754504 RepID=A0A837C599_9BRAD|nr:hypothetical protein BJS_05783 [Bradyrhizobium japonicum SEMIA 5079]KGJ64456.1 hypothetical protein BJA5080_07154 [Bradyrhizobium diazoefficiens SEMIA 5080]
MPLEAIEATVLEGHRADTRGLLRSCVGFFQLGDTLAQRGDLAAQLPYLVAGPVGAALGDFLANVVCFRDLAADDAVKGFDDQVSHGLLPPFRSVPGPSDAGFCRPRCSNT